MTGGAYWVVCPDCKASLLTFIPQGGSFKLLVTCIKCKKQIMHVQKEPEQEQPKAEQEVKPKARLEEPSSC